jgi:prophage regulatory protein
MEMRDLIDLKETASMLGGLHPEHVRQRLLKRPDFPRPFRIAGKIMLDREEVADWIESQRQPLDGRRAQNCRTNA